MAKKTITRVEFENAPEVPAKATNEAAKAETQSSTQVKKQRIQVKNTLTPSTYVSVRSGFNGRLVYKSSRTNERFVWEEFGAEHDMELQELKSARSSHKSFFENNWFLIDDPEVIAHIGAERFYKNSLKFDEFDKLFDKPVEEINQIVSKLSAGQKQSLAYRARQLIAEGLIDSIKTINTLEKLLETELIEK